MIAEAVRGSSKSVMASTSSDIKNSVELQEDVKMACKNRPSTNGEVEHGEERELLIRSGKDNEEMHESSEDDEDKLVINEGCEKKENQRLEGVCSQEPLESPPKSPLKRTAEEEDVTEVRTKKLRTHKEESEVVPQDIASSFSKIEASLSTLKNDLHGIGLLLHQKEEEWNSLLRLQKKKEEMFVRLTRKKQIMQMNENNEIFDDEEESEKDNGVMFLPQGSYASLGSSHFPLMMMKYMLSDPMAPQIVTPKLESKDLASSNGPVSTSQTNISVIDIHTSNSRSNGGSEAPQISISAETQCKLGKQLNSSLASMKPILPKPMNCGGIMSSGATLSPIPFPATGYGPQGPTVSVHHLIAAHRKDNPNVPPIRGAKRGAWRHRYEKRSSSREPDRPSSVSSSNSETEVRVNVPTNSKGVSSGNASNNMLTMTDPSVSYKDVLLQFAQLTQTEKQPGSPQISIIPVGSSEANTRKMEPIPDSTSISREIPFSSQPSNLEGSSALAKLLLESGANSQGSSSKLPAVDLSSCNNSSPQYLTLSALLSGGTTTTVKDKTAPSSQMECRPKKGLSVEEGGVNPKCQGCHKHRAQFVCAGCGNQWYCSRECQVAAWEEHSEHCSN